MSVSFPRTAALGTPDVYREFIAHALGRAEFYANLGQTYAEAGDDAGLAYSVRSSAAYIRIAVSTLPDLNALKAKQATRGASAGNKPPTMEGADAF